MSTETMLVSKTDSVIDEIFFLFLCSLILRDVHSSEMWQENDAFSNTARWQFQKLTWLQMLACRSCVTDFQIFRINVPPPDTEENFALF